MTIYEALHTVAEGKLNNMLEVVKQLLALQERDRSIHHIRAELVGFEAQRRVLQTKASESQTRLETIRTRLKQIESERKKLELDAESKKQMIERYSLQQYQTKKNDEYRALTHEIDNCRQAIVGLEDRQLDLMEQAEAAQKEETALLGEVRAIQEVVCAKMDELKARETELNRDLEALSSERTLLAAAVAEPYRVRYERCLKQRGEKVLVGIDHGVCAGCHMRLTPQTLVSCQSDEEIVTCPNCGRILYYTPEMDLAHPED
ncbi:MAG TPA: C4-type zinc ribbon domain-containing protein [Candidatus Paceibacterota bacterium]|nr:C4-type zinc ribbon domain-containing protein [Verrucomicrobiota bacterium]HRY50088.1 C4-type zinc ribbon domain-containing protein [Candidatus Paceibacterota bacterium]HRZ99440.1 C4-type zinc ribbon domain-containing protein [Candidatus Paceibacterota bacterium]